MSDLSNAWKLDIAAAGSRISDKSLSPVALTEETSFRSVFV